MASKKYLNLEEVAARLALSPDQVNKFREDGQIRGFADRGTWKFKADDVDEFARTRQVDSAPDVPIMDDEFEDSSFVSPSGVQKVAPGRSVVSGDDDDGVGEQPTVIRSDVSGSAILDDEPLLASSDSDVRLVLPEGFSAIDSNPDVSVQGDSDSDVRLMDQGAGRRTVPPRGGRSDSDVQLVGEDADTVSDVRLLSGDDVPVAKSGSDSDVSLVSARKPAPSIFDDDDDMHPLSGDSGIALESIADSGIALEDSVIGRRSGPGIESSIISLADDSGIALAGDSGKRSGIDVGSPTDSGIALEALNAGDSTQPMMNTVGRRATDSDETQFELGSEVDDSEFELATGSGSSIDNDTSVILFEDEADDFAPAPKRGKKPAAQSYDVSESDDVVELDEEYDAFDEGGSNVGMDDDLEFEAADEDFDDGFQTGESQSDFAPAGQRVVVAPEAEISGLTFGGLAATSALMVLCGMLMFDLVRSMWGQNDPMLSGWLLEQTKGLF